MKHTPAPWVHWQQYNDDHEMQSHICQKTTALIIARCDVWKDGSRDEMEANARLIAKSPELLELVKSAYDRFTDNDMQPPNHALQVWLESARALIAELES